MTDTSQRIAIAEACGIPVEQLEICKCGDARKHHTHEHAFTPMMELKDLPDYLNDLNAMHEVAMWLRENHPLEYVHYTAAITALVAKFNSDLENRYSISAHDATARQRADAFVQIIEKWKDEKK